MRGILTTLVGQATGRAPPRLRPRVPALFETAADTGPAFEAVAEGRDSAAETQDRTERPAALHGTGPAPEDRTTGPHAAPAPLLPEPRPAREVARRAPAPERRAAAIPPQREARAETSRAEARVAPVVPAISEAARPPGDSRDPADAPPHTPAPARQSPRPPARAEDPPPLLLPHPPPPDRAAEPVAFPAAPPRGSPPGDPAPVAPEITIHIGRIDLRQPAAPPVKKPARKPARAVTSLSDYLKGGRG